MLFIRAVLGLGASRCAVLGVHIPSTPSVLVEANTGKVEQVGTKVLHLCIYMRRQSRTSSDHKQTAVIPAGMVQK